MPLRLRGGDHVFATLGVLLLVLLMLVANPAPAHADNYVVRDGTGATLTFCSKTSGTVHSTCPSGDSRTANANITAVDAATSTVAGQGSVTLVTGTPTASSSVTWTLNGHSSATLTVTGTFSATAQIETSADSGTTYGPAVAKLLGANLTSSTVTGPGVFRVDVTGMTHIRLRATTFTSGTLAAQATSSASSGLAQVLNPLVSSSAAAASTNGSTTVTAGGTYQTVFSADILRKGCLIQNPTTATEVLNVRQAGAIVWTVPIGATFRCSGGGVVVSDLIEVTAATTGHAFTAAKQ